METIILLYPSMPNKVLHRRRLQNYSLHNVWYVHHVQLLNDLFFRLKKKSSVKILFFLQYCFDLQFTCTKQVADNITCWITKTSFYRDRFYVHLPKYSFIHIAMDIFFQKEIEYLSFLISCSVYKWTSLTGA